MSSAHVYTPRDYTSAVQVQTQQKNLWLVWLTTRKEAANNHRKYIPVLFFSRDVDSHQCIQQIVTYSQQWKSCSNNNNVNSTAHDLIRNYYIICQSLHFNYEMIVQEESIN